MRVLATKFRELGSGVDWGGGLHNGFYSQYMNIRQLAGRALLKKQRTTSIHWLEW